MTESDPGEEQVYQAALEEWLGVLAQLWTAAGKPVEADRLDLYASLLEEVPLGLLERAVRRLVRENVYQSVPMPGAVWRAVREELGNPPDLCAALQRWRQGWWG